MILEMTLSIETIKECLLDSQLYREALENFAGCAVIISHDRWFLDRVCTHILAFEGDGNVYYFEGGYSEYEENKKKRLGEDANKPFRHKKLVL